VGWFFFNIIFICNRCGFRRFSLLIFDAYPFPALSLVCEGGPGGFGPVATFAHMVERCPFRLHPRLLGTGEEEL
jgi:hypothetical protein